LLDTLGGFAGTVVAAAAVFFSANHEETGMNNEDGVRAIIERHTNAFRSGDVSGLIADYAKDAVLLTKGPGVLKGSDAIRQLYEMVFRDVFPPSTTKYVFEPPLVGGNVGLLHWSATTPTTRTQGGVDAFFVHDGKIVAQTGAVEIIPR
jgi:uncharacterized protein (TIGR02246 family)